MTRPLLSKGADIFLDSLHPDRLSRTCSSQAETDSLEKIRSNTLSQVVAHEFLGAQLGKRVEQVIVFHKSSCLHNT